MPPFNDLTGQKYGRLTVMRKADDYISPKGYTSTCYECLCDCGEITIVRRSDLISGRTKSCGCFRKEVTVINSLNHKPVKKHGKSNDRLYHIWAGMKERCTNKNNPGYIHYGGRGIKLFNEWYQFISFYEWAMNNGYDDSLTIDRIDVDGNYEPSNCRWVTMKEQCRNKRDTIKYTINGEEKSLSDWCEIYGATYTTVVSRIKSGVPVEDALLQPAGKTKYKDLTGQTFGMLTVLYRTDDYVTPKGKHETKFHCKCECGNETDVLSSSLRNGRTKSCGCNISITSKARAQKRWADREIVGTQIGRLFVLERADDYVSPKGYKQPRYECQCECGNITTVLGCDLRQGKVTSCGCYRDEIAPNNIPDHTTHGMSRERLYNIWSKMKDRCNNPNNDNYHHYGGRGIKICKEWDGRKGFDNFAEWATRNGYSETLTIDRIDVNGDYEPINCRWATNKEQANNKRNTLKFIIDGEERGLAEWCRMYKVKYTTATGRIRNGWTIEEALEIVERKGTV